jgi:putative DNA methylase
MSLVNRKLIEVAMPLEAINRESSREKAIRQGHPSTLHLWWARRPLSACRTVLFAQLVDDPSSRPDKFPTLKDQEEERNRLLEMVERLSRWESMGDHTFLNQVHKEIKNSFVGEIPSVFDPFAGGGSIPLEAQRLGLRTFASDLNPVAVLLNKALIEIPPSWIGLSPVAPGRSDERLSWPSATGLAYDVKYYGEIVLKKVKEKIGDNYPVVANSEGHEVDVVAWIWARTVTCPSPACGVQMPLARSFWLRKDSKHSIWIKPVLKNSKFKYEIISSGKGPDLEGTVSRTGGICLACGANVTLKYIREQGKKIGLSVDLMAIIATGIGEKVYLPPDSVQTEASQVKKPENIPTETLPINPRDFKTPNYGLTTFASLFTNRQLLALTSFSDEIIAIQNQIEIEALNTGLSREDARKYAVDVVTYLTLALGRCADYNSSICTWHFGRQTIRNTFARQAIPMTWDFAETNILGGATGNWTGQINWIFKVLENLNAGKHGVVRHLSATDLELPLNSVVSTDPPYYDNIGYADLSDYFYIWIRRTIQKNYPELMSTLMTPKTEELVATPYRFGGNKEKAEVFFEDGFIKTFKNIKKNHDPSVPMTVFYAFKQSEDDDSGTASTGWETMLKAILAAGFSIDATWPIRTELSTRMIGSGKNALASSIVLACRVKSGGEEAATRRNFLSTLKSELPIALRTLQQASIAPVDLAQAAIGPGMSIYSRFAKVIEADGSEMTVRTALQLINQALDEVITEQEGDFDSETRFCLKWFSQYGWNLGTSGEADVLSRAVNTSINVLERGGVFKAVAGKANLVEGKHMSKDWDPLQDKTISAWEVAVRVAHALQTEGLEKAVFWSNQASKRIDLDSVKELSYLLFSISEKNGWTESAILFNGLGTSWSDMNGLMSKRLDHAPQHEQLDLG